MSKRIAFYLLPLGPIEIIFLRQYHTYDNLKVSCLYATSLGKLDSEEQESFLKISESQYNVARFIIENPEIPVIAENSPSFLLSLEHEIKYNKSNAFMFQKN